MAIGTQVMSFIRLKFKFNSKIEASESVENTSASEASASVEKTSAFAEKTSVRR